MIYSLIIIKYKLCFGFSAVVVCLQSDSLQSTSPPPPDVYRSWSPSTRHRPIWRTSLKRIWLLLLLEYLLIKLQFLVLRDPDPQIYADPESDPDRPKTCGSGSETMLQPVVRAIRSFYFCYNLLKLQLKMINLYMWIIRVLIFRTVKEKFKK